MAAPEPVSLAEILRSRDERAELQRQLISRFHLPLLCLLVNMPGPVKQNENSRLIHQAGCAAILAQTGQSLRHQEIRNLKTGPEGFFLIEADPVRLKEIACRIEDSHPLGRLFDLDVLGLDCQPISRTSLGLPRRRCLVCGDDGAGCSRSQKHSLNELQARIEQLIGDFREAGHG